jgi:hypothetical protein
VEVVVTRKGTRLRDGFASERAFDRARCNATSDHNRSSGKLRAFARGFARTLPKGAKGLTKRRTPFSKEKTLFPLRGGGVGGGRGGGRGVRLLRVALVIVALGLLFPPPTSAAAAAAAAVRGAARRALHVGAPGAGDVDGFRLFVVAGFDVVLDNLLLFRSFRRRVKTRRWREGRRSVRGAPAQRGGDDSVRRDSRKNNGIGRARTDSPRKTPFAVARGVENRKPKTETNADERWALSPSRRRVALTVTRESRRNAVIARTTRAPA